MRSYFIFAAFLIGFLRVSALADSSAFAPMGSYSPDGIWQETKVVSLKDPKLVETFSKLSSYRTYELSLNNLLASLTRAPMEDGSLVRYSNCILTLPMPDGSFSHFAVMESPILSHELQAARPDIRTYVGQGLDDPASVVRFDHTPLGFHATIITSNGMVIVDPVKLFETVNYVSFYYKDTFVNSGEFHCTVLTHPMPPPSPFRTFVSSGTFLKTYRCAIGCPGEYTQYFGSVSNAQAAATTTFNRLSTIYENDIACRMSIVSIQAYPNPATDPYTNGASVDGTLLSDNQTALDAAVGNANYDFGHCLTASGGGGVSYLGVVCNSSLKAQAATGSLAPTGVNFDLDYVAHEVGHTFGADHTFNSTSGACSGGNRTASSAYEPGSASTIMSYAGICAPEDVQPHSDGYFHTRSFDQMVAYRDTYGTCRPSVNNGNSVPTINPGANYTIPIGTPFKLNAVSTDANGDTITYCWEQFDLGTASPTTNNATRPLFRTYTPTTKSFRTFPKLPDILSNAATPWEILPTVARTMHFRCTVRDNRAGGGGVNYGTMTMTVNGTAFAVTNPVTAASYISGASLPLTWSVGGGSVAANVNILFSSDGGSSFDNGGYTTLAANVPNSGSANIPIPYVPTSTGRIKIEPVGNVFFAINKYNLTISEGTFGLTPANASLPSSSVTQYTATIPNAAPFGGLILTVTTTGPVTAPATVTVPAGSTFVNFNVTAGVVATNTAATVKIAHNVTGGSSAQVSATVTPVVSVVNFTGNLTLTGYAGTTVPISALVTTLLVDGLPTPITLSGSGTSASFTVPLTANATHILKVKPKGFLTRKLVVVTAASNLSGNFVSSIPGDSNGDDIIDDTDMLAVINNFLSITFPAADFNGDGLVDDTDMLDVINNFLQHGDA